MMSRLSLKNDMPLQDKYCMTRSSTKELLSPFENPEQKFCLKRRLFDTPSIVESNSPEFDHIFDIEEIPFNPKRYYKDGSHTKVAEAKGLTPEMRQDLAVRLRMVYFGEGQMSDTEMGLDVADTLCFQLGGVMRRMTWRQFILALELYTEQEMVEAPEKVTGVDLFYIRSIDHGTTNFSHLLAQYMFRHAEGRKSRAMLPGWHFIGCLAMHLGLVSDEGLRGLQVVTRELSLIDLHELERLNICMRYGDTWAWVAQGPERQQATAAGAHEADEAGLEAEEGS
ncbi:hypothetical protein Tco_0687252 [Tanacetum coccineum]